MYYCYNISPIVIVYLYIILHQYYTVLFIVYTQTYICIGNTHTIK